MPFDPSLEHDRAVAESQQSTFTNDNKTVTFPTGNPRRWYRIGDRIKMNGGRTFYVEIVMDNDGGAADFPAPGFWVFPVNQFGDGQDGGANLSFNRPPRHGTGFQFNTSGTVSTGVKFASSNSGPASLSMDVAHLEQASLPEIPYAPSPGDGAANGRVYGYLIDFDSFLGPNVVEITLFADGVAWCTWSAPINISPDDEWGLFFNLQQASPGGSQWTVRVDPSEWTYTPPKGAIPWSLPLQSSSYVENFYCRFAQMGSDLVTTQKALIIRDDYLSVAYPFNKSGSQETAGAVASTPRYLGKYYFEVTMDHNLADFSATNQVSIGVCSQANSPGPINGVIRLGLTIAGTPQLYGYQGSSSINVASLFPYVQGDVFMFAFDFRQADMALGAGIHSAIYIGKNGTWFGTMDPANDLNGLTSPAEAARAYVPVISFAGQTIPAPFLPFKKFDFNFGADAFVHTPPSGYSAWDDTPRPGGGA